MVNGRLLCNGGDSKLQKIIKATEDYNVILINGWIFGNESERLERIQAVDNDGNRDGKSR